MNDSSEQIVRLLTEIRDDQKALLEINAQGLAMQKEQRALNKEIQEKTLQSMKASESLQSQTQKALKFTRRAGPIALVIMLACLAFIIFLIVRSFFLRF
ncbi:MAG: hypothetical protein ABFD92_12185 [Planctomycetaceae bacterium]|nr:hypothetical protein [Planctomycetaceae bacterium]